MLYNTLRLESFGDWNLLDMDSTAKQPRSISTLAYRYNCMRDTQQIVPWDGIALDVINSGTTLGTTVGAWRPTRGPQFFAKEFYDSGAFGMASNFFL